MSMSKAPYVWLTMNHLYESIQEVYRHPGKPDVEDFDGLVMMALNYVSPDHPPYAAFLKRWRSLDPVLHPGAGNTSNLDHTETAAYACTRIIALGYQRDIEESRKAGISEETILRELRMGTYARNIGNLSAALFSTIDYDGPGGYIKMDEKGNTISSSSVFFQLQNGVPVMVAKTLRWQPDQQQRVELVAPHTWQGLRPPEQPMDAPDWVIQNIAWTEPVAYVMVVIVGLGILTCIVFIGVVIWHRKNPVIKASSALFCVLELIGIMIAYTSVPMHIGRPTTPMCTADSIVLMLGLSMLLGSLVVKNLRIYRIFNNVFQNKYAISDKKLFRQFVAIVFMFTLSPIIYAIVLQPVAQYIVINATKSAYVCVRTTRRRGTKPMPIFGPVSFLPLVALLAFAGYLAYQTQNVSSKWNESRQIIYTIYAMVLTLTIFLPTMFLPADQLRVSILIQNITILFALTASLLILFVPKFLLMRQLELENRENAEIQSEPWVGDSRPSSSVGTAALAEGSGGEGEGGRGEARATRQPPKRTLSRTSSTRLGTRESRGSSVSTPKVAAQTSGGFFQRLWKRSNTQSPASPTSALAQSADMQEQEGDAAGIMDLKSFLDFDAPNNPTPSDTNRQRVQSQGVVSLQSGTTLNPTLEESRCDLGIYSVGPSDDAQVPVRVESRGFWFFFKRGPWCPKRVILISSLATIVLSDETKATINSFVYTRVVPVTNENHHFLLVNCVDAMRLKIEFPNELARDQWLLAFDAPSQETADLTMPTMARRLSTRTRLKLPRPRVQPFQTQQQQQQQQLQQLELQLPQQVQQLDIQPLQQVQQLDLQPLQRVQQQVQQQHQLQQQPQLPHVQQNGGPLFDAGTFHDAPTITNSETASDVTLQAEPSGPRALNESDIAAWQEQLNDFQSSSNWDRYISSPPSSLTAHTHSPSVQVPPMSDRTMDQFMGRNDISSVTGTSSGQTAEQTGLELSFLDALCLEETDPTEIPPEQASRPSLLKRLFQ
ncbi:hypothetical protein BGZ94_007545 [Podila epigama]|nr:hypothetical protein BGZ94_007545 [Podila epigama]